MSKKDELTIVLWLNSNTSPNLEDDDTATDHRDGIYIFDDYSAGKLFTQGVSVYPSVHPDFLSKVIVITNGANYLTMMIISANTQSIVC